MTLTPVRNDDGLAEYSFTAPAGDVGGGPVPGLLWRPDARVQPTATVLIGHGRTSDKRAHYVVEVARLCTGRGWNAVAIDAPGHGERRAADAGPGWPRPDPDETAAGWHAALSLLREEAGLDTDRLAYWGISMGASLGISLIAGDPRFQAAVLGLMHADWPAPPGTRIRADAGRLECPVLFLMNWDDTRAPRARVFELFDLIGSADKRLHAYPGEHGQLPEEAFTGSVEFLARYL